MRTVMAQGASAPSLVPLHIVSDRLSEAFSLTEALYLAAGGLSIADAIRTVLGYLAPLIDGARNDVDTYGQATQAVAA